MGKRKKLEPSVPSKAYLVSFGDTMTALLAFFIVLNSLAREQTGANLYAGTGSFANAFAKSGTPGHLNTNRSRDMIRQKEQKPIYALAENLDENEGKIGPDSEGNQERIIDREKEQFQKFLTEIERELGLKTHQPIQDQVVFDSFAAWDGETGGISKHAIHILSDLIPKLRQPDVNLEVIIWASMPSKTILEKQLLKSAQIQTQVESMFWLKATEKVRIKYRVKPWLFSDAKRPVLSVVFSKVALAADSEL